MKKLLTILALAFSLNAFAAPENEAQIKALVPAKEGTVAYVTGDSRLFKNASNIDEGMKEACPLLLVCTNVTTGNLAVTDKALLFVVDGAIVKKISRADIASAKADKYTWGNGTVFVRTTNYEGAGALIYDAKDFAAVSELLGAK